jgi:fructose-1,6-bisphosphatase/inositol monophosphatase family enzyme
MAGSTLDGNVSVSLADLTYSDAPCSTSLGKAIAESAIGNGCDTTDNVPSGTTGTKRPLAGVLNFSVGYAAASTAAACSSVTMTSLAAGTIDSLISGGVHQLGTAGTPLVLSQAGGVCVGVTATWPTGSSGPDQTDNAAQRDSLGFDVRIDLVQQ